MATIIEKSGKTVEDALQDALKDLGVSAEEVEVEVLETPSKGFFGFGAKPARIKVALKEKIQSDKPKDVSAENFTAEKNESTEEIKSVEVENDQNFNDEEVAETNFDKTEVIERAKKFLSEVLVEMHIEAEISVEETDYSIVFNLSGKNLGMLIGKHGQTLDALQYLTNLAANKNDSENRVHFVLDVENYRERRTETLQKLAKSVADRAVRMRQDVKLEPMNRHERRIIHTALQNNDRVETRSAGEEPYRYIIVSPKRRGR